MTEKWKKPMIEHGKLTKFNYIVQYPENLKIGVGFDIGSFTYINSKFGVEIQDNVQIDGFVQFNFDKKATKMAVSIPFGDDTFLFVW